MQYRSYAHSLFIKQRFLRGVVVPSPARHLMLELSVIQGGDRYLFRPDERIYKVIQPRQFANEHRTVSVDMGRTEFTDWVSHPPSLLTTPVVKESILLLPHIWSFATSRNY